MCLNKLAKFRVLVEIHNYRYFEEKKTYAGNPHNVQFLPKCAFLHGLLN